jgi:hypothetical protein
MTKPIPFEKYAAIKAINWSTLKELRRSPAHYRHRLENPREDTTRLALGRAVHTAVLEPHRFLLEYACFDGERRAGKAWEAFAEMHVNRTILKRAEYEKCIAVGDAVRRNAVAANYLARGAHEQVVEWTDPDTGLPCKARIDWVGDGYVLDLKTTNDVEANRFAATAARMGYFGQGAFYAGGLACTTGKPHAAIIVAVEMDAPHDVAVYRIDDDSLYAAAEEVRELLRIAATCREVDLWPGRYTEEQTLRMPRWMLDDESDTAIDDEIVFGAVAKEA